MANPMVMKLRAGTKLTEADCQQLEALTVKRREVPARTDLITESEAPLNVHLVLEGFACRYKTLPNGRRQIVAYLIPGDFCDLHVAVLGEMDHSIGTLAPSIVADIPSEDIIELTMTNPRLARALWWATLVDEGILREWLVGMGQRPAAQRLAHLLCELHARFDAVGHAADGSYHLPLTQSELADTLGMTTVHANRTLQLLRRGGYISTQGQMISIPDFARLSMFASFDPNYLHYINGETLGLPPGIKMRGTQT